MLSPGWEYSAARKVSWKSSSRTATPLAQAAHSHETRSAAPKTLAPGDARCPSACPRALTTGIRRTDAIATPALSMTRLTIISATSSSTPTGSVATSASRQASWSSVASRGPAGWTSTTCSITADKPLARLPGDRPALSWRRYS